MGCGERGVNGLLPVHLTQNIQVVLEDLKSFRFRIAERLTLCAGDVGGHFMPDLLCRGARNTARHGFGSRPRQRVGEEPPAGLARSHTTFERALEHMKPLV